MAELIYTTYKYYNIPILSLTLIKLNMISRYRQKSRREGEVLSGSRSLALEGQNSWATPEKRGGRGADGSTSLGLNFLCRPRGSRKDRGKTSWFEPPSYSLVKSARPYNNGHLKLPAGLLSCPRLTHWLQFDHLKYLKCAAIGGLLVKWNKVRTKVVRT